MMEDKTSDLSSGPAEQPQENTVESLSKELVDKEIPEYVLKWGDHNNQLLHIFQEQWRDKSFTDVSLTTDCLTFQAHKLVLSACSPYFRSLFIANPANHPVVFVKDISSEHMALLLEYMYRGCISVKQEELQDILKSASTLQIRGLTTTEPPDMATTPKPLIVDEFQTVETGSSHSSTSVRSLKKIGEGRKSTMPKRLRLSGDRESCDSSPGYQSAASHNDDGIAVSEEETDIDTDQPMDFTKTKLDNSLGVNGARFSILGSYLKSGKDDRPLLPFPGLIGDDLKKPELAGSWLEPLANLARSAPRPDSRDSRGDSRDDRDNSGEENMMEERDNLGIDIANKLRSHFLANLPAQSYAWLNGINGVGSSLPSSGGYPAWLSNISDRASRSQASLMDTNKMADKHPMGGIRTGEIGANGKPTVKCEVCGKKLADPSSLYRHRKIHSGDKPHKCPYCERRFIQRYNMKQHIKTHRIELLADQKTGFPMASSKKGRYSGISNYQDQDHSALDMSN